MGLEKYNKLGWHWSKLESATIQMTATELYFLALLLNQLSSFPSGNFRKLHTLLLIPTL